jgi:hypothetical protein
MSYYTELVKILMGAGKIVVFCSPPKMETNECSYIGYRLQRNEEFLSVVGVTSACHYSNKTTGK